jgi:hypothetical protein
MRNPTPVSRISVRSIARYLATIDARRQLLWCAFLWYLVIAVRHGEASASTWATAIGIAVIVGVLLAVNAIPIRGSMRSLDRWTIFRFFLIPFCVSSLSAIVKGRDFFLIFPLNTLDNTIGIGACVAFFAAVGVARMLFGRTA